MATMAPEATPSRNVTKAEEAGQRYSPYGWENLTMDIKVVSSVRYEKTNAAKNADVRNTIRNPIIIAV